MFSMPAFRRPATARHRLLLAIAIPLVVVLVLEAAGWPGLAPRLAAQFSGGAERLSIDLAPDARMRLLIRPGVHAARLSVKAASEPEPLAAATGVDLRWRWADLWRWRQGEPLRLRALEVQELRVRWLRDADGYGPWAGAPPDAAAPQSRTRIEPPRIDTLRVAAGRLSVDDAPLDLRADARFHTVPSGRWEAAIDGDWRGQALQMQASAEATLPLLADEEGPPVQLQATLRQGATSIAFEGTAASLLDARRLQGQIKVSGASLADVGRPLGVSLPRTKAFTLQGKLQHAAGVWDLNALQARVGASSLGGDFRYRRGPPRARLTGQLLGGPLLLADLGPAIGTDRSPQRAGRVLPDQPINVPALGAMDADVDVALSRLESGSSAVAPLHDVRARLLLESGVLHLANLRASIVGGEIQGDTKLDARAEPPRWDAKFALQRIPVDRWLPVLRRTSSGTDAPASVLTGQLEAQVALTGQGRHVAELLGHANGTVNVVLRQGELSHLVTELLGIDVAQGLGVWLRGDDNLPLQCAVLQGDVKDGLVQPRVAVIDNRDSRIELSGQISLATETFDLRAVARPRDFSPLTLRAPLRIEGSFADPRVALEGRALGGRALAALALGSLAPPAALLAFVDPGERLPPLRCG